MDWLSKIIENIAQVIDIVKSNFLAFTLAIASISWSFLLLPANWASTLHIDDFQNEYSVIIGVSAFISTLLILIWIISKVILLLCAYFRGRFEIPRLTQAEKQRLYKFVENETQTYPFFLTDGVLDRLVDKGLVYKANSDANSAGEKDYHLYRWVYQRLISDPSLVIPRSTDSSGDGKNGKKG